MKPGPLPGSRLLIAIGLFALFGWACAARADRPEPVSESKTLHEFARLTGTGGGIVVDPPIYVGEPIFTGEPFPIVLNGNATLSGSLTGLQPIGPIPVPILSFYNGTVDLVALLRSGTTAGSIDVAVDGYAPGVYTVSAVTESSSDTVVLGSLTVTSGSIPITTGSGGIIEYLPILGLSSGHAKFGTKRHPFPDGFSPFDVATVSLSDSNDDVVSTATLTPAPDGYYTALSPMAAGTVAPGATGYALVHATTPPLFLPLAGDTSLTVTATPAVSVDLGESSNTTVTSLGSSGSLTLSSGATTADGGTLTIGGNLNGNAGVTVTSGGGGTLTLAGSNTYVGTTTINGGTLTLNGSPVYVVLGGSPTGGGLHVTGPVVVNPLGPILPISPGLPEPVSPRTGRIAIRGQGLPASTTLFYAADGMDLGTATTDSAGNLKVYAAQGGKGKLPGTLDLFGVTTITVHDEEGRVYLSAGF